MRLWFILSILLLVCGAKAEIAESFSAPPSVDLKHASGTKTVNIDLVDSDLKAYLARIPELLSYIGVDLESKVPVPEFYRLQDDHNGHRSVQIAFSHYQCRDGITVTLIPMDHVGEPHFYERARQEMNATDFTVYEGIRQRGFFGPPFEPDDRLKTSADLANRTRLRLQSVADMAITYKRLTNHGPKSLSDLTDAPKFLVDTWGHPIQVSTYGNITEVSSASPNGRLVKVITPKDVVTPESTTMQITDKNRASAQAALLEFQSDGMPYSSLRPTDFNGDVSEDMVNSGMPVDQLQANVDFRNYYPVMALIKALQTKKPRPKSLGLMYGYAHMPIFDRLITGTGLGCVLADQKWTTVFEASDDMDNLTPQELANRKKEAGVK